MFEKMKRWKNKEEGHEKETILRLPDPCACGNHYGWKRTMGEKACIATHGWAL